MSGGIDAVGAGAEIDSVQINFENLVFCKFVLEPEREQGLADLARKAPLGRQKQVLRQLLSDRAAAFNNVPGGKIGQRRTQEANKVDTEMAVEAPILGGDDRLRQIAGHLAQAQGAAKHIAISRQ